MNHLLKYIYIYIYIYYESCGKTFVSAPNQVVVVYSFLGQRLIRHEWEASLPDVGLSKFLRIKAQRHFQRWQYLIEGWDESPPTKKHLLGFKGKPPPSPFRLPMRSYMKECTTIAWVSSFWDYHYYTLHICSSGTLIFRPKAYKI